MLQFQSITIVKQIIYSIRSNLVAISVIHLISSRCSITAQILQYQLYLRPFAFGFRCFSFQCQLNARVFSPYSVFYRRPPISSRFPVKLQRIYPGLCIIMPHSLLTPVFFNLTISPFNFISRITTAAGLLHVNMVLPLRTTGIKSFLMNQFQLSLSPPHPKEKKKEHPPPGGFI